MKWLLPNCIAQTKFTTAQVCFFQTALMISPISNHQAPKSLILSFLLPPHSSNLNTVHPLSCTRSVSSVLLLSCSQLTILWSKSSVYFSKIILTTALHCYSSALWPLYSRPSIPILWSIFPVFLPSLYLHPYTLLLWIKLCCWLVSVQTILFSLNSLSFLYIFTCPKDSVNKLLCWSCETFIVLYWQTKSSNFGPKDYFFLILTLLHQFSLN